jgi:hypothetical protein
MRGSESTAPYKNVSGQLHAPAPLPWERAAGGQWIFGSYVFMAWCLVKYRNNFTFYLYLLQEATVLLCSQDQSVKLTTKRTAFYSESTIKLLNEG